MAAAEGTFDQALTRARYEEAQWKELRQGESRVECLNKALLWREVMPATTVPNQESEGGTKRVLQM